MPCSFFATVTTSDVPSDASNREQILKNAIQNEIFSTSKIDSYSGNPLNILSFLHIIGNSLISRSITDLVFSWCNEVFNCATYWSATGWIQYHCVSLCMPRPRLHKGYYPCNVGEVLKKGHIPQPHHSFDSRYVGSTYAYTISVKISLRGIKMVWIK